MHCNNVQKLVMVDKKVILQLRMVFQLFRYICVLRTKIQTFVSEASKIYQMPCRTHLC